MPCMNVVADKVSHRKHRLNFKSTVTANKMKTVLVLTVLVALAYGAPRDVKDKRFLESTDSFTDTWNSAQTTFDSQTQGLDGE